MPKYEIRNTKQTLMTKILMFERILTLADENFPARFEPLSIRIWYLFRISIFGPPWCDIASVFAGMDFSAPKSLFDPDFGSDGLGQGFRILSMAYTQIVSSGFRPKPVPLGLYIYYYNWNG